jgi:hypothetical protein
VAKWKTRAIYVVLFALAVVLWIQIRPERDVRKPIDLKVTIVDYTVPSDYRKHIGIIWVLNNLRVRAPGGFRAWRPTRDYVGYYPDRRNASTRLESASLRGIEVLYIADTYGVYRDDVADKANLPEGDAPLLFGGLSLGDAMAASRFVSRGGTLFAEFNSFCDPTQAEARRVMEELLGVEWSGWTGRLFLNPGDENEVPAWVRREFTRQFPDRPFPQKPMLLFVNREAKLFVVEGTNMAAMVPRIELTAEGIIDLGVMTPPVPYYGWFPLMRQRHRIDIYARWQLPHTEEVENFLREQQLDRKPPVITRKTGGTSRAFYLGADFSDLDFDPGRAVDTSLVERRLRTPLDEGPSTAPAFFHLYAPMMAHLLPQSATADR